jgi:hypothetical protein
MDNFDKTGTIGSLPCERSLNNILAERGDPKLVRKVMRLLMVLRSRLKSLKDVKDQASLRHFRLLLRRETEKKVTEITGVPVRGVPSVDALASHTMCVINAYFSSL